MTQPEPKRNYPYLSATAWADLRKRLRSSIPKKIDKEYLHTALGVSDKAAANLLPQLKTVGLINDEFAPTDLIHDYRDDDKYADACRVMVQRVYPPALTDVVPDPSAELDAAIRWFMRQGAGEATAKVQARFYAMLVDGEIPESTDKAKKPIKATPSTTSVTTANKATAPKAEEKQPNPDETNRRTGGDSGRQLPSVHVDLQIHISPDSSAEQIDAIFASMSKHLYGR